MYNRVIIFLTWCVSSCQCIVCTVVVVTGSINSMLRLWQHIEQNLFIYNKIKESFVLSWYFKGFVVTFYIRILQSILFNPTGDSVQL